MGKERKGYDDVAFVRKEDGSIGCSDSDDDDGRSIVTLLLYHCIVVIYWARRLRKRS